MGTAACEGERVHGEDLWKWRAADRCRRCQTAMHCRRHAKPAPPPPPPQPPGGGGVVCGFFRVVHNA